MAIRFPRFEGTKCRSLTACGQLPGVAPEESAQSLPNEDMIARYRAGGSQAYIRILGSPGARHFHVDVALGTQFGGRTPKVTSKVAEVRKVFAGLDGREIRARISAAYYLLLDDVQKEYRSIFVDVGATSESRRIRVRSVEFAVNESSLETIQFSQPEIGGEIRITLKSSATLTIGDDYLIQCFSAVDEVISGIVLNAKRKE